MIIRPSEFPLPTVEEHVILFFNLQHLFQFKELVQGSKIRSFGPSKRFSFTYNGVVITAIGGMISAPLAVMTVEHVLQAGGRKILSFGSAGWIAQEPRSIGTLITPNVGLDTTGMSLDYDVQSTVAPFKKFTGIATCEKIVSVNSVYRLSIAKVDEFRRDMVDMVDMESAALNQIIPSIGGEYRALFVISDRVESDYTWNNGFNSLALQQGVNQALGMLPTLVLS